MPTLEEIKPASQDVSAQFLNVDAVEFDEVKQKLYISLDNDSQTRKELVALQREKFDGLTEADAATVYRLMAQLSVQNDHRFLTLMRLSGHECEIDFVSKIEEKLGIELPNARIAADVFRMTYLNWDSYGIVPTIQSYQDPQVNELRQKLKEIQLTARRLAEKSILATHSTRQEYSDHLETTQFIEQSSARTQYHYEGSGVYTGILGSYRNWGGGKTVEIEITLGDTIPRLSDYCYPSAMANVLCEVLDIDQSHDNKAIPHGLVQWEQRFNDDETIPYWKILLMEELLNTKMVVVEDDIGEMLIANVWQPPIEWASLARALQIRRLVPLEEYSKIKDEIVSNTAESEEDDLDDEEDYKNLPASISLNKKLRRRLSTR